MQGYLQREFWHIQPAKALSYAEIIDLRRCNTDSGLLRFIANSRFKEYEPGPEADVMQGELLVSELPPEFVQSNRGKFAAISFNTGNVLCIANSLGELNTQLVQKKIRENCYVKRFGYSVVAKID